MIEDVFCKIINKELGADVILENDDVIAINDIHPQAPVHVLILPKKHITDIPAIKADDVNLLGKLIVAANVVAQKMGLTEKGFRLIINQGEHGGQLVPHLHVHLLGGRKLGPKIVHDKE